MNGDLPTEPRARQLVHGRQITCRVYRRDDGDWDLEGKLLDVKTHDEARADGIVVAAGEPCRTLTLTVLLDEALTIRDARLVADTSVSHARAEAACKAVIDWQIGTAFAAETKDFFGRAVDCPHCAELFAAIVATAREAIPLARPALIRRTPAD